VCVLRTGCRRSRSIDPRGLEQEAKNKYHWRLEVRIFVSGTEGVHNED